MTEQPRYNQKLIDAKLKQLERFRKERRQRSEAQRSLRLPPGQHEVKNFPVLDLGVHPPFDPRAWRFAVAGEVESPRSFTWEELGALPKTEQVSDFHCVTTWSRFGLRWGGVRMRELCALVKPTGRANFVLMRCADGYTTNTTIHEATAEDALLAYELDGAPVPLEHGGPLRMLLPTLYAWKSAKFLIGLEFRLRDEPGYWETRGYHNNADPWLEQRYGEPGDDGFAGSG